MRLRRRVLAGLLLTPALLLAQATPMQAIQGELNRLYPAMDAFYLDLHEHPELSGKEVKTALKVADQMRKAGFEVTTGLGGARAMIADGLFTRFPKPDFALALHDAASVPAGQIAWVEGYAYANVDSVDITLFGKGGHGASPQSTVDPIVLAARTVLALQTLISREKDPMEPGVITVGSIHAGTKHNIIPDEAKLQLTVRSYAPAVRKLLLEGIIRIVKAEAAAGNAPKEPLITFSEGQDALYNDPAFTRRLVAAIGKGLGANNVVAGRAIMGAEDFGEFGKAAGIPSAMLSLGAVEPTRFQAAQASGEQLPNPHSPLFAPDKERSIRTGVEALVLAALEVLAVP